MRILALTALAAVALATPAQAQKSVQSYGEDAVLMYFFNQADKNKDAVVSEDEFDDFFEVMFNAGDTDNNDRLTLDEAIKQKERERDALFRTLSGKPR
ncbi:MAG: hypothetical protein KJ667_08210 [Alphaproteobacteria bacterium]|nr:hypothetical protein [Alphaproteobacteria bacterium]